MLLTRAADAEADDLSLRLAADGVPLLRLDSDRCCNTAVTWSPDGGTVTTDAGAFRPLLLWRRYFAPASVAPPSGTALHAELARSLWTAFAAALVSHFSTARGGAMLNAGAGHAGIDRTRQLECARGVGLRTPFSLVSTTLAAASAGVPGDGDLMVKSLAEHVLEPDAGTLVSVPPRRLTRAELALEIDPEPAPLLLQEFVVGRRELRVYVVGTRQYAYDVVKPSPSAVRTDPDQIETALVEIPATLANRLSAMMSNLRLDVAAFDLIDTDAGIVFLEVNTVCAWRWTDRLVRSPLVSRSVADAVARRFRSQQRRVSR